MNDIQASEIAPASELLESEELIGLGLTGVALLDVLDEEGLLAITEVAAKAVRRYLMLLTAPVDAVGSKLSDEMANNLLFDFHRRLWGVREESNS